MQDRIWFAQMLRGFAALLVVYRHLAVGFWVANPQVASVAGVLPLTEVPELPHLALTHLCESVGISGGPLGVALFFLISGFVIPLSLERLGPWRFLLQRILRLYPTYAVGLAFTCLVMATYSYFWGVGFEVRLIDYLINLSMCRDWFGTRGIDGIVWTLEIEVKFYLLCGGICLLSNLRSSRALLLTAGVFSLLFLWANQPKPHPLSVIAISAPYLTYMLIGICFFNHQHNYWTTRKSLFVGVILAAASVICFAAAKPGLGLPWHFFLGSYGTAIVCFLLAYALQTHIPRFRVLDWLANISYPLYILHGVAGYILLTVLVGLGFSPYLAIAITILISLVSAHVLHHTVEKQSIRLARWILHREAKPIPQPAPRSQNSRAA